jgi:hypothetical protein
VVSRWEELLLEHLASTDRAKGESGWKYKQRLIGYFAFPIFWARQPETLRISIDRHTTLLSLEKLLQFPVITTVVHPKSPFYLYSREKPEINPFMPAWDSSTVGISDDDLYWLSTEHRQAIFSDRYVKGVRWLVSGHLAVDWSLGDYQPPLISEKAIALITFEDENVICFRLHSANYSDSYVLLNAKNEFARWVLRINEVSQQGLPFPEVDHIKQLNDLLKWSAWFPNGEKFPMLCNFINRWRAIPNLPQELIPPSTRLTYKMFMLPARESITTDA